MSQCARAPSAPRGRGRQATARARGGRTREPPPFPRPGRPPSTPPGARGGRRREQVGECRRQRLALVERAQEVLVRGGMDPAEQRQDLLADQAADRVAVRGVVAIRKTLRLAVATCVLAPDGEERPDDAVL